MTATVLCLTFLWLMVVIHVAGDLLSDGSKTPWSPWSSCSTSCGAGQQERMRKCGAACTEVESMVCVNPQCEGEI